MADGTTLVILAAGKGTRMKGSLPKVLAPLCGRPLVAWVMDQACALAPDRIVVVVGTGAGEVGEAVRACAPDVDVQVVEQEPQLGTGHALQVAAHLLGEARRVVVLYGDMPLLRDTSLSQLVAAQTAAGSAASAMITATLPGPHGYGRIVRDGQGHFSCIVEELDCTPEQRAIAEVNTGVYCFDGPALLADLPRLESNNAQGEYYLTDLAGMAVGDGREVVTVGLEDVEESFGVNTMADLADVRSAMQMRILDEHMAAGVLVEDPASTYIDHDVRIGEGTRILPCTVIRAGVTIGAGCEVGPFTHLRAGTTLEDGSEVGNFTECKNSTLGEGTKAKHLSYLGDVQVGARTNVGAGTIFANYDGREKHTTRVGDGVFVGSGTIVVAPNELPDGATTGAGAVITRGANVGPGEVFVGVPARKLSRGPTSKAD